MLWILHQCHLTASFFGVFCCYGWLWLTWCQGLGPTHRHTRGVFSVWKKRGHFSVGRWRVGVWLVQFVKAIEVGQLVTSFWETLCPSKMTIRGRLSRIGSWCSRFVGCFRTSEATFSVTLADSTTQRHDWHECGGWSKHCELLGCKK